MNTEKPDVMLIMVRGLIASMPEDEQKKVGAAAKELRELIERHSTYGQVALALIAAETSAREGT